MDELERLKKEAADAWRVAGDAWRTAVAAAVAAAAVAAAAEDAAAEDAAWRAVEETADAWRAAASAADAYAYAAQESFTYDLWLNLYPDNGYGTHGTLKGAEASAGTCIIARKHLILTARKGEGL